MSAAPAPAPTGVVVIGASAGGVEALRMLVGGLSADIPAAVMVAVHVAPFAESTLPAILNRAGDVPAAHGSDAEPLRAGRIYVAPPDRHLLVAPGRARVTRGPRENGHRPAIDALFRSAAFAYGPATVGVVLSGILDDGAAGIATIREHGGVAIVQSDATYADMPRNAIENAAIDHVVPLREIAATIESALATLPEPRTTRVRGTANAPYQLPEAPGPATEITCPACGGVLTVTGDEPLRFRCRVGHAYNAESLLVNHTDALERSLWTALRALEERSALLDRLADRFRKRGSDRQAERYDEDRSHVDQRAEIIRRALLDGELVSNEAPLLSIEGDDADQHEDVAG